MKKQDLDQYIAVYNKIMTSKPEDQYNLALSIDYADVNEHVHAIDHKMGQGVKYNLAQRKAARLVAFLIARDNLKHSQDVQVAVPEVKLPETCSIQPEAPKSEPKRLGRPPKSLNVNTTK